MVPPTCSSVNFCCVFLADSLSSGKYSFNFLRSLLLPFDPLLQDGHWHVVQAQIVKVRRNMTTRHSAVEFPTIAETILMMRLRIKTAGIYKIIIIPVNVENNNCHIVNVYFDFTFLIKALILCSVEIN